MLMINRELTEIPNRVFQCGHFGWFYTDHRSRVFSSALEAAAAWRKETGQTDDAHPSNVEMSQSPVL